MWVRRGGGTRRIGVLRRTASIGREEKRPERERIKNIVGEGKVRLERFLKGVEDAVRKQRVAA